MIDGYVSVTYGFKGLQKRYFQLLMRFAWQLSTHISVRHIRCRADMHSKLVFSECMKQT